jgi:16S rRNA (cytidine1402-2'-O)-methyltransferase
MALPGSSSVLTALALAALPTDRFFFEGFLPSKQGARRHRIAELARIPATLVMFESGNRVQDALTDLASAMPKRDAAICRELTKLHEEVRRGPLATLAQASASLETRGEFVLVVGPPPDEARIMPPDELDNVLRAALKRGSVKDAVADAAELSGRPRREVYARALELAGKADGDDGDDTA